MQASTQTLPKATTWSPPENPSFYIAAASYAIFKAGMVYLVNTGYSHTTADPTQINLMEIQYAGKDGLHYTYPSNISLAELTRQLNAKEADTTQDWGIAEAYLWCFEDKPTKAAITTMNTHKAPRVVPEQPEVEAPEAP